MSTRIEFWKATSHCDIKDFFSPLRSNFAHLGMISLPLGVCDIDPSLLWHTVLINTKEALMSAEVCITERRTDTIWDATWEVRCKDEGNLIRVSQSVSCWLIIFPLATRSSCKIITFFFHHALCQVMAGEKSIKCYMHILQNTIWKAPSV